MKHWKVKPFKKINNIDLFEYLNYRYDGYGRLRDNEEISALEDGDVVEYITNEYNSKKRKTEKIKLIGVWLNNCVYFSEKKTTVFTKNWLKLISREHKNGDMIKELQRIHNSKIDFAITTSNDKFEIILGTVNKPLTWTDTIETITEGISWLIDKVLEYYHNSLYSFIRISLINKIRESHVDTDKFTGEFLNKILTQYETDHPEIYLKLQIEYDEMVRSSK